MSFAHRGVVEGFYGTPWTNEDRRWLIERMGRAGMNCYVYAPKDDPLQRERWREAYAKAELREFASLVEHGAAHGVGVGFAVSPGGSMVYGSREDRRHLLAKLRSFVEAGSRFLCLAVDDVPSELQHEADRRDFGSLGHAHVDLANEVRAALAASVTLWLVPTDYLGTQPTHYLETLGEGLDPEIEVGWTGRTVVSPQIRVEEAAARAATLRRKLLVWDNVPVADGAMRVALHLAPYTGREPGLPAHVSGLLLNPMERPRASWLALATAAEYMRDPAAYAADAAWERAVEELGGDTSDALRVFALAHRFSALTPDERDRELEPQIASLREALHSGVAADTTLRELAAALAVRLTAGETLAAELADKRLRAELDPWLESHARETRRMQAAVGFLASLGSDGSRLSRVLAFARMQARLTRHPPGELASYGPRRIFYPQFTSMRDDEMALGPDPVLYRDRCLADDLIQLTESHALDVLAEGPGRS